MKILGFKILNFEGFHSQEGQDAIIFNYFGEVLQNVKKGLFVDVGANHPTKFNNSYFFEEKLMYIIFVLIFFELLVILNLGILGF